MGLKKFDHNSGRVKYKMISDREQRSFLEFARPPSGMSLTYCIGTTYTLDYPVIIQLALATHGYLDDEEKLVDPAAFSRIQSFNSKSVVFSQSCKIQNIPKEFFKAKKTNRQKLLSLLDSVIVNIRPNEQIKTFHPKIWFLRFDHNDKTTSPLWNLMITSRNLSEAKTWEIGTELLGTLSNTKQNDNLEISHFLEFLKTQSKNKKAENLINLAIKDLPFVKFEMPEKIKNFKFMSKLSNKQSYDFLDTKKYSNIIGISPFLSKGALKRLDQFQNKTLITSVKDSKYLESLEDLTSNTYLFKLDGLDLHAKMYLCRKKSGGTDVYLGSANLTTAGSLPFGQNIEALVCLSSDKDLLKDFEKKFIFKDIKKKTLMPWLRKLTSDDFADSSTAHEDDKKRKDLDLLRHKISEGSFVLKKIKMNTWELKWLGEKINWPKGITGQINVGDSGEPFNLQSVISGRIKPRIKAQTPMSFIWIKLIKAKLAPLEFGTVAELVGKSKSRSDLILNTLVSENPTLDFFQFILNNSTTNSNFDVIDKHDEGIEDSKIKKGHRSRISINGLVESFLLADIDNPHLKDQINKVFKILVKKKNSDIIILKDFWKECEIALDKVNKNAS